VEKNIVIQRFIDISIIKRKVEDIIVNVPNFPKVGIQFKDITPLFKDINLLNDLIEYYALNIIADNNINKIVCIDSRGFIFGSLLAHKAGLPFILARKSGKLPRKTLAVSYELEYGINSLEIHESDITPNDNVLIVDDLLATGGTIEAVSKLVIEAGGRIIGIWNLIELDALGGRAKIKKAINNKVKFYSLINY
jgi:adenine phosphoribosyltransferase